MNDNFCIHSSNPINYIESDTNKVEVIVNHSKYVNSYVNIPTSEDNTCGYVYDEFNTELSREFYKYEKQGLYDKKIIVPKEMEITVKANRANLETIKQNVKEYTQKS